MSETFKKFYAQLVDVKTRRYLVFRIYENDGEFDGGMKLARVQIAAIRITMCGVLVIISKILNSMRHSHKIYC